MRFWTEEIRPSVADEWRVVAVGAKESPAALPAPTYFSPVMHKLKIVWLHGVKQGKEVHLREGGLTDFLQSSTTHSGVSRLPIWVCGQTSQRQTTAMTTSFCSATHWGIVVPKGEEGCRPSIRQPHGPYNLLPHINWNTHTHTNQFLEHLQSCASAQLCCPWCLRTEVEEQQLCTSLIVEHFTKEHYLPAIVPGPDTWSKGQKNCLLPAPWSSSVLHDGCSNLS